MIQLNHYKYEPTLHTGKPQCEKVLEYRFAYEYEGNSYLVEGPVPAFVQPGAK
ncbi:MULTISPECIES: hypothetical protein [Bacillaceae]|uniref:Uncharacterized protein n=1 Tax=Niallia circulans TaxID=1397 RepID=A0A941GBL9_NIACI|nr:MULTISPECIES: hypothetical protein [Bacillaceae]MDU1847792.1 hypothetical protein [Niallia nealsonii]SLL35150.1 Uncharacterised protein [Mycobacteroides abscessus subsp. abscessus]HEO8421322.1 hypothetical protein [Yersinia enterocolitica]MCB5237064.1 hypothetical protein [Niallia circulans]MED5100843.1 hypothetical protein [Niallia circulans]